MSENRYLDDFTEHLGENGRNKGGTEESKANAREIHRNDEWKSKILKATHRKLRRKRIVARYAIAACVILAVLSSFIPDTPAFALRQNILSYIPGIGVVQSTDEADTISGVLAKPVRVTDGEDFLEIRSAYVKGNVLTVNAKTNIGILNRKHIDELIDKGKSENIKDLMEFSSGESAPKLVLYQNGKKTTAGQLVSSGYSLSSKTYNMQASFYLDEAPAEKDMRKDTFRMEMEGFPRQAAIALSPVKSGTLPEDIRSAAVIGDVMVFAHASREEELLEVLVSVVAPGEYKHPRCYLFDHEKKMFPSGIYLTDQSGTRYEPDEEIRKERDGDIHTFYFPVPEDKDGLKLVIPQILFTRESKEGNMKFVMPKGSQDSRIDGSVQIGSHTITLKRASFLPVGSGNLPDDFKDADCLTIDAGVTTETGSRETLLRILPSVQIARPRSLSGPISQSVHAEFWDPKRQSGTSFIHFDKMSKAKTIRVDSLQAEFSMAGPWEIPLEDLQ